MISFISFCQSQVNVTGTKIEILGADELVYDKNQGLYQMCRGNVRFKQGEMFMDCDSARFYEEVNKIEAFGHIYIRQKDTLNLWGDYLEYDGDFKLAKVSKNVKLTDGTMTLKTQQLNYDMNTKVGFYNTGGHIDNGRDKLFSEKGTYYSRTKDFFFKDSVRLTNEDYVMTSDTLKYNTDTKMAYFHGPTYITSDENTIFCNYGWYNTEKEMSQFSKGAYIEGAENRLEADSMVYNRNTGLGEAYGNLLLTDTTENISITGQFGSYQRFEKTTLITGNPIAVKNMGNDSLFLKADTLIDFADTSNNERRLIAYHNTQIFKSDLQSVSDSMIYHFQDSLITFFGNPVVWADSNQITGDTIIVFQNSLGIERLESFKNGFIVEKDPNGLFNQISGKVLTAYFVESKLKRVVVEGNGESIYYALEDSTQYAGVNSILCGRMLIKIDTNTRVRTITFYTEPKAVFYPLEKLPSDKAILEGFEWKTGIRPKRDFFIN